FGRFAVLPGASHPSISTPCLPELTCKIRLEKAHSGVGAERQPEAGLVGAAQSHLTEVASTVAGRRKPDPGIAATAAPRQHR
ncbi:hypothetical protein, partial [Actinoplanes awajinensis]|uniref:hypothetical protein n=1 Tax=Actinoplanes awajinensis TaxID=135946 RepID=UPI001E4D3DE9